MKQAEGFLYIATLLHCYIVTLQSHCYDNAWAQSSHIGNVSIMMPIFQIRDFIRAFSQEVGAGWGRSNQVPIYFGQLLHQGQQL